MFKAIANAWQQMQRDKAISRVFNIEQTKIYENIKVPPNECGYLELPGNNVEVVLQDERFDYGQTVYNEYVHKENVYYNETWNTCIDAVIDRIERTSVGGINHTDYLKEEIRKMKK